MTYDRVWYWRARLPERKGQRCRVLARGGRNTVLVEFEDGYRVTTSRHAVRSLPAEPGDALLPGAPPGAAGGRKR